MRLLLNVLTVALLMAFMQVFTQPLQAQAANVDAWFSAPPADGSWSAGGDIEWGGDPNCEFCGTDVELSVDVQENGVTLSSMYGSDPSGLLSLAYDSPTIVNLNGTYVVNAAGAWYDQYGPEEGGSSVSPQFQGFRPSR